METNLALEGIKFMFLGMGVVFLFLLLMVGVLKAQAHIINKYFPEPKKVEPTKNDDKKVVAAITAAIMHYKNSK